MDSINRNQSENNHQDLAGAEAIEKLKELADGTCFFCTHVATSDSEGARPMAVLKVDDQGALWFLSSVDSHKNQELGVDQRVDLYFQGSKHSDFLHLTGSATLSKDRNMIEELWTPIAKTWFTEGKDDPRITVIKFSPQSGYYWDTKHGNLVAGIKILIGAATGRTMDDSIEGRVDLR